MRSNPEWSAFMHLGSNVQIDPDSVQVGDILQSVPKEEATSGAGAKRILGNYVEFIVVAPDQCFDTDEPELQHCTTICPECVETWSWDHLLRRSDSFVHGSLVAYDTFGCRCPKCRLYKKNRRLAKEGKPLSNFVQRWGRAYPNVAVESDLTKTS
jgi:hypothetical protein